tara:strand:- start:460 stop:651 length:192 start_codon:yes stop_codon:yes gene_type:complete
MNFQRIRHGYRKIKDKLKRIIRTRSGKKIIKLSIITYDISRVVYNPFYLIEIARRVALKNLLS